MVSTSTQPVGRSVKYPGGEGVLLSLSRRGHRSSAPRAMICLFLSTRYAGGVRGTILSNEMKVRSLVSSQLKKCGLCRGVDKGSHIFGLCKHWMNHDTTRTD
jgi:hypothetical protein